MIIALLLLAAGMPAGQDTAEAERRRHDVMFDCALQADQGGAKARYAVFVPSALMDYRTASDPGEAESEAEDEPNLAAFDPAGLIRFSVRVSPVVETRWGAGGQVVGMGLQVQRRMAEGIHGGLFATGEQGGTLSIDGLDRAAGTARATIVQYANAETRAPKATYTGPCRFVEGAGALPQFESIKQ